MGRTGGSRGRLYGRGGDGASLTQWRHVGGHTTVQKRERPPTTTKGTVMIGLHAGVDGMQRAAEFGRRPRALSHWAAPGDERAVRVNRASGSYALVQDIAGVRGKAGIRIEADRVELHLGGFEIVGCDGSLAGIEVSRPGANIGIRAGRIRGWGREGIDAQRSAYCEMDEVEIKGNGGDALLAGCQTVLRDCRLSGNGHRPMRGLWRLTV